MSRRGTLWSYTENRYPPPPPYPPPDPFEPFAVAAVELADEGIIVLGKVVEGTLAADLKVGMEMELATMPLFTDDDGVERLVTRGGSRNEYPEPLYILGAGHAPVGQVGQRLHRIRRGRRPRRAGARPAWTGGRFSWSPAPTPSATATRASSPGRRSRRSWAGTACRSAPATPRAPAARRPCRAPAPSILAGFCDVALVIGADTTPKGFFAPVGGERKNDPDWQRFHLIGAMNPVYFALLARRRMDLYGATL